MNLTKITKVISERTKGDCNRSKAISQTAQELGVTIPTIYRWIKEDDHLIGEDGSGKLFVFKQMKVVGE